jgi:hypothetical protein
MQPLSLLAAGYVAAVYGAGVSFLAGAGLVMLTVALLASSRELRRL